MSRTLRTLAICAVLAFATGVALADNRRTLMAKVVDGRIEVIRNYTQAQLAADPTLVPIVSWPTVPHPWAYDADTQSAIPAPETQAERQRRKARGVKRRRILRLLVTTAEAAGVSASDADLVAIKAALE